VQGDRWQHRPSPGKLTGSSPPHSARVRAPGDTYAAVAPRVLSSLGPLDGVPAPGSFSDGATVEVSEGAGLLPPRPPDTAPAPRARDADARGGGIIAAPRRNLAG